MHCSATSILTWSIKDRHSQPMGGLMVGRGLKPLLRYIRGILQPLQIEERKKERKKGKERKGKERKKKERKERKRKKKGKERKSKRKSKRKKERKKERKKPRKRKKRTNWILRNKFKSRTRLFTFHFVQIPLEHESISFPRSPRRRGRALLHRVCWADCGEQSPPKQPSKTTNRHLPCKKRLKKEEKKSV